MRPGPHWPTRSRDRLLNVGSRAHGCHAHQQPEAVAPPRFDTIGRDDRCCHVERRQHKGHNQPRPPRTPGVYRRGCRRRPSPARHPGAPVPARRGASGRAGVLERGTGPCATWKIAVSGGSPSAARRPSRSRTRSSPTCRAWRPGVAKVYDSCVPSPVPARNSS
jgi:hypothetical protein